MLFKSGNFTSTAGLMLNYKIECDALTDSDWQCIAQLIGEKYFYKEVFGVPTGGNKLAEFLQNYTNKHSDIILLVDDVLTTGKSMEEYKNKLYIDRKNDFQYIQGVVLFNRGISDIHWIDSVFTYSL